MKKRLIVLVLTVMLSISSVAAINSYAADKKEEIKQSLPLVLKSYENCVAVYRGDELLEVFDTVVYSALPEYDRNQLKRGMLFDSMSEVYSVIEDFDG